MEFGSSKKGKPCDSSMLTQAKKLRAANIGRPATNKQNATPATYAVAAVYAQGNASEQQIKNEVSSV